MKTDGEPLLQTISAEAPVSSVSVSIPQGPQGDSYLLNLSGGLVRLPVYNSSALLTIEKPALIHGDLWSGNIIVNHNGMPCLIDPAVYYGHRESDIAMTRLFGGFPNLFYEAYNDEFPMNKGWEERIEIHQLYPLLVHVNLFGQSYVPQVRRIIRRFC